MGTRNRQDQHKIVDFLSPYPLVYPGEADARWAMERFEALHLSRQVEIMDCFIAALGVRLELPIYSRNVRDLGAFDGVAIVTPY